MGWQGKDLHLGCRFFLMSRILWTYQSRMLKTIWSTAIKLWNIVSRRSPVSPIFSGFASYMYRSTLVAEWISSQTIMTNPAMSTGQNRSSSVWRRKVICKRKPWWGSPFYTASCFHLVRHLLFESPWGPFSKLVSRHQDMSSYLRRTRMHHMHHTLRTQSRLRALKSQAWHLFLQRGIKWFSEIQNDQNDPKLRRDEWDRWHPLTTFITSIPLSSVDRWQVNLPAVRRARHPCKGGWLWSFMRNSGAAHHILESLVDRSEMDMKSNLFIRSLTGYGFKVQHQHTYNKWYLLGGHLVESDERDSNDTLWHMINQLFNLQSFTKATFQNQQSPALYHCRGLVESWDKPLTNGIKRYRYFIWCFKVGGVKCRHFSSKGCMLIAATCRTTVAQNSCRCWKRPWRRSVAFASWQLLAVNRPGPKPVLS